MGKFSDILITSDFDRTLTDTRGEVPRANLEAIRYFMEEGGAFTVNTGRSVPLARLFLDRVEVNAPLILYNGAAAYDTRTETLSQLHPIGGNQGELLRQLLELYPDVIVEVQGLDAHYTFSHQPGWERVYDLMHAPWGYAQPETDFGPLLKISVNGPFGDGGVEELFAGGERLVSRYDEIEADMRRRFSGQLSILRATPVILDLQGVGVNKGSAARQLAQSLGRGVLVCIGDERNDLAMLDEADIAYCPAESAVAALYPNAAPCGEGTVADVIRRLESSLQGTRTNSVKCP